MAAYQAQLQVREGHDVWDRLGAITCPVRVGYGNYDGIAPAQNSINIASRIRGAELHGYEGGHGFLFQDPAALPAYIVPAGAIELTGGHRLREPPGTYKAVPRRVPGLDGQICGPSWSRRLQSGAPAAASLGAVTAARPGYRAGFRSRGGPGTSTPASQPDLGYPV